MNPFDSGEVRTLAQSLDGPVSRVNRVGACLVSKAAER